MIIFNKKKIEGYKCILWNLKFNVWILEMFDIVMFCIVFSGGNVFFYVYRFLSEFYYSDDYEFWMILIVIIGLV